MSHFLGTEKLYQIKFKASSPTISQNAKREGTYKSHFYPFCLPRECEEENLFPPIRDSIRVYFRRNKIKWHDGQDGNPSNHMCDSQVCCVNFLFPFANQPQALAAILKPVFPELLEMLPVEDGLYVAFEWIGEKNNLGEKISKNGKRTRGANFTSADAAVRFRLADGRIQMCLIEWKYTESYSSTNLVFAKSGQSRLEIYRPLLEAEDCPIDTKRLPCLKAMFYEPFYQFMRQQLLAHEMEKAHEQRAKLASVLRSSP